MSADYRFGLELTALVPSGPNHSLPDDPTQARQWAHLLPSGEYRIDGDQAWTHDGRGLEAQRMDGKGSVFPEGTRIVHRDITIGYGPWVDQATQMPIDGKTFTPKPGQQVRAVTRVWTLGR